MTLGAGRRRCCNAARRPQRDWNHSCTRDLFGRIHGRNLRTHQAIRDALRAHAYVGAESQVSRIGLSRCDHLLGCGTGFCRGVRRRRTLPAASAFRSRRSLCNFLSARRDRNRSYAVPQFWRRATRAYRWSDRPFVKRRQTLGVRCFCRSIADLTTLAFDSLKLAVRAGCARLGKLSLAVEAPEINLLTYREFARGRIGKTDDEIGTNLSITPRAARFH